MKFPTFLLGASGALALGAVLLAGSGCSNRPAPLDPMAEGLTAGEKPVSMKGEGAFLDGKLTALATVSRGFDRGAKGTPTGGRGDRERGLFGRGRDADDRGLSGITEVYHIGGESEEEQKEAYKDYVRQAMARRAAGSPMPPVTLRVKLQNKGTEPVEIEVTEVNSDLGNFAVRPSKLTIAPGEIGELNPMVSQLGVTSDEIPLKVSVRTGAKRETQVIALKNLIVPSLRK